MVTLFYQTAIDHIYFYEIEFAKLIIRYLAEFCYKCTDFYHPGDEDDPEIGIEWTKLAKNIREMMLPQDMSWKTDSSELK